MSTVAGSNIVLQQLEREVADGLDARSITLRFPPEPNGYLHIGHARAICLNFDLARRFGGRCLLRLDDTNPATEQQAFADAILDEVRWLGYQWDGLSYTSDYFGQLYDYTVKLIDAGLAYVDDQSPGQVREGRGSLTSPGRASPFRERAREESLDLLAAMRAGRAPAADSVVRARIDMASDNLNMRDPVIWRQRRESHYRLGDSWRIFPLYDFSHCLSDAIEGITHSLCTLEFADHRPLYDWFLDHLLDGSQTRPRQIEFARMNIAGALTSKRRIAELHRAGKVRGFDDPRLMTLAGLRKRGIDSGAILDFCRRTPITRAQGDLEIDYFLDVAREGLNREAPRAMAVLRPLRVVIENLAPGQGLACSSPVYPQGGKEQTRELRLEREIFIERDDYREQPERDFRRLAPGRSVRLRSAGVIRCLGRECDGDGELTALRCHLVKDSKGAKLDDLGNKVRATVHWVAASSAVPAEIELLEEGPGRAGDEAATEAIAPIERLSGCLLERGLAEADAGAVYQFERLGYFHCLGRGQWLRCLGLRAAKKAGRASQAQ